LGGGEKAVGSAPKGEEEKKFRIETVNRAFSNSGNTSRVCLQKENFLRRAPSGVKRREEMANPNGAV